VRALVFTRPVSTAPEGFVVRMKKTSVGLVLGTFVLAAMARQAAAQSPAVEIATGTHIPVAAGATLEFRGVNGEASFLNAPGEEVVIEYARDVPADVRIVRLTTADGVTVCTVYASSDPKKPTECLPGGRGRLAAGKIKDQSRVRFRIRVPPGVHVTATIDQGDLKSSGIVGNLRLYSNNGYVLVHDGGGPGTIHAGVGLLGNVDAVIAKDQKGPVLRQVRLEAIGNGRVRVAMPTTVTASYSIATQQPAVIDKVFGVEKVAPPVLVGHLGPAGDSQVRLNVDTGIAGQFVLLPAK
jgi:hypothetical protein